MEGEKRNLGREREQWVSAHQTRHTHFDGVWEGMSSSGQGGEGLKSEAEEGLKAEAEGNRQEP